MKKRILSILLTLCMVLCLVPTGVFAEGETLKEVKVADEDEIIAALADSTVDVVKLISDIDLGCALWTEYEVTLDLNGHVLKNRRHQNRKRWYHYRWHGQHLPGHRFRRRRVCKKWRPIYHERRQYCGLCGQNRKSAGAGRRRVCG